MANWSSKRTDVLKFTLSTLISNMDNAKNVREKRMRGKAIKDITEVLRSRGENV